MRSWPTGTTPSPTGAYRQDCRGCRAEGLCYSPARFAIRHIIGDINERDGRGNPAPGRRPDEHDGPEGPSEHMAWLRGLREVDVDLDRRHHDSARHLPHTRLSASHA